MIVACTSCGAKNRIPSARLHQHPRCGSCKQVIAVDAPVHIGSAAEFDELIAGSRVPVVVDFWATWCPPCRAVAPQIDALARTKAGKVVIAKVDTDAVPDVAGRFGIRSIPTFIRFDGGQERTRASGAMQADALARSLGI